MIIYFLAHTAPDLATGAKASRLLCPFDLYATVVLVFLAKIYMSLEFNHEKTSDKSRLKDILGNNGPERQRS